MVTLLEAGVLGHFTQIFSLIFVIAVVYGILELTKIFGSNKGLHILIAFIIGLITLLTPDIANLINTMLPWFTFFFIFVLFVLVAYKIFGATDADIVGVLRADRTVTWVILIVCIVIVIGSFASVYGPRMVGKKAIKTVDVDGVPTEVAGEDYSSNIMATFFHPKILGIIFIMLVAVFTIAILAGEAR